MKTPLLLATALLAAAPAGAAPVTHYPPAAMPGMPGMAKGPPFSAAVMAGDTLYLSGTTDTDPATGKPPADVAAGARLVMENIRRSVEKAGLTMNDLVWVQVFATNLADYAAFNDVYRTYFTGPLPARAFIGAGSLLGGAHFEVMGIAVRAR
ncbi:RidA family protein [Sphingomonas profundi]|uniref:RidA family protein n=1 Tax=Alterirhizorhabdus profundi TaxID=2681549 RepID=UPI0018D1C81A|nr:RidA family protein [Sphingomonas profundi]